jgi:hypothetical protein
MIVVLFFILGGDSRIDNLWMYVIELSVRNKN